MAKDYREAAIQVLHSYPDETIDAMSEYFDEELDYILEVFDQPLRNSLLAEEMVWILQNDYMNSRSEVDNQSRQNPTQRPTSAFHRRLRKIRAHSRSDGQWTRT